MNQFGIWNPKGTSNSDYGKFAYSNPNRIGPSGSASNSTMSVGVGNAMQGWNFQQNAFQPGHQHLPGCHNYQGPNPNVQQGQYQPHQHHANCPNANGMSGQQQQQYTVEYGEEAAAAALGQKTFSIPPNATYMYQPQQGGVATSSGNGPQYNQFQYQSQGQNRDASTAQASCESLRPGVGPGAGAAARQNSQPGMVTMPPAKAPSASVMSMGRGGGDNSMPPSPAPCAEGEAEPEPPSKSVQEQQPTEGTTATGGECPPAESESQMQIPTEGQCQDQGQMGNDAATATPCDAMPSQSQNQVKPPLPTKWRGLPRTGKNAVTFGRHIPPSYIPQSPMGMPVTMPPNLRAPGGGGHGQMPMMTGMGDISKSPVPTGELNYNCPPGTGATGPGRLPGTRSSTAMVSKGLKFQRNKESPSLCGKCSKCKTYLPPSQGPSMMVFPTKPTRGKAPNVRSMHTMGSQDAKNFRAAQFIPGSHRGN